ncbi:MAG: 2-oxo acid dehydrogenase subunit E2 [Firmicutes bacterium]|nr:2-oxo acid dehydrogenase subunit E2 [Bacillota bacterium]
MPPRERRAISDEYLAGRRVPLSPMRRAVARNMLASWQAAPQFSLTRDVDMTAVLELRRILAPSFAASRGVKLSPVDFLIQAAARALAAHPDLNATFTDEGLVHHDTVDVGLATATEDGGLLVPVVRGADRLTLVEIAARRQELVELARRGRLAPDAVGGTFTISNLGPFDVDRFHAIVQPGETAILAVGRIQERPAVREGQLCVRPLLTITLTVDHRAADGAAAARFLQDLVARLERDEGWLLF